MVGGTAFVQHVRLRVQPLVHVPQCETHDLGLLYSDPLWCLTLLRPSSETEDTVSAWYVGGSGFDPQNHHISWVQQYMSEIPPLRS